MECDPREKGKRKKKKKQGNYRPGFCVCWCAGWCCVGGERLRGVWRADDEGGGCLLYTSDAADDM
eukprot:276780-Rhodomonas_salina.1